jgi:predicted TIM-barrel fold metal-dependent hydrolase
MICESVTAILPRRSTHTIGCGCASRRSFLRGGAALAAAAALPSSYAWAQEAKPSAENPHRIDVHHHYYPPELVKTWKEKNIRISGPVERWSLDGALKEMDAAGVATSVLSMATGLNLPNLNPSDTQRMTRMCNDYAAKTAQTHKGRFGVFGFMPLPDVDATLKEIAYCLDTLKADGIGFNTSYGDKYLGDKSFAPVMEELNRRKAVAYIHPTSPDCCSALILNLSASFVEYPQETNRVVMNLLFTGQFSRWPDIRWIFSHGGAAVPLLAGRVAALAKFTYKNLDEIIPKGIPYELARLYYETANAAYAPNMAALMKIAPVTQIMFGSDFPYVKITENKSDLLKAGLSAADLIAIERDNAVRLMPGLKSA